MQVPSSGTYPLSYKDIIIHDMVVLKGDDSERSSEYYRLVLFGSSQSVRHSYYLVFMVDRNTFINVNKQVFEMYYIIEGEFKTSLVSLNFVGITDNEESRYVIIGYASIDSIEKSTMKLDTIWEISTLIPEGKELRLYERPTCDTIIVGYSETGFRFFFEFRIDGIEIVGVHSLIVVNKTRYKFLLVQDGGILLFDRLLKKILVRRGEQEGMVSDSFLASLDIESEEDVYGGVGNGRYVGLFVKEFFHLYDISTDVGDPLSRLYNLIWMKRDEYSERTNQDYFMLAAEIEAKDQIVFGFLSKKSHSFDIVVLDMLDLTYLIKNSIVPDSPIKRANVSIEISCPWFSKEIHSQNLQIQLREYNKQLKIHQFPQREHLIENGMRSYPLDTLFAIGSDIIGVELTDGNRKIGKAVGWVEHLTDEHDHRRRLVPGLRVQSGSHYGFLGEGFSYHFISNHLNVYKGSQLIKSILIESIPVLCYTTEQTEKRLSTQSSIILIALFKQTVNVHGMMIFAFSPSNPSKLAMDTVYNALDLSNLQIRITPVNKANNNNRLIFSNLRYTNHRREIVFSVLILKPYRTGLGLSSGFSSEFHPLEYVHRIPFPILYFGLLSAENTAIAYIFLLNNNKAMSIQVGLNEMSLISSAGADMFDFTDNYILSKDSSCSCQHILQDLTIKCMFHFGNSPTSISWMTFRASLDNGDEIFKSKFDFFKQIPSNLELVDLKKGDLIDIVTLRNISEYMVYVFNAERREFEYKIPSRLLPLPEINPSDKLVVFKELSPSMFMICYYEKNLSLGFFSRQKARIDIYSSVRDYEKDLFHNISIVGVVGNSLIIPIYDVFKVPPASILPFFFTIGTCLFLIFISVLIMYWFENKYHQQENSGSPKEKYKFKRKNIKGKNNMREREDSFDIKTVRGTEDILL